MTDTAFLVLHFQNGVAHPDGVWGKYLFPQVEKNGSVGNARRALDAARARGMLVVYVNIAWRPGFPELPDETCGLLKEAKDNNECLVGSWGADVIDELKPEGNEIIVTNFGSDSFEGTDLDLILTPVGGGGLVSGTALTVRSLSPPTRVIAAEPRGADDAYRSFRAGRLIPSVNPQTIADGLLTSLGDKTFAIIRDCVDDIVTVEEADIVRAMRLIWERMKIIVEPSAAVPLGALLGRSVDVRGKRVAIILSGGNVDLARLPFS